MPSQWEERNFATVGGLKEHIDVLKEMVIYPLLYGEVFESYGIQAPRGVLFHGPPGTGKTLTAAAVAAECSKSSKRRVSFYKRKGADCLNKYVGESEKHLRNLFVHAHKHRPSIIFFDEIDGLVPTRSESQEVHASIVSTLLALMDGLDSKSQVFVIGATNRIDMIDPALRRPGRFDKELYFPLPSLASRMEIFRIHTRNWKHKPSDDLVHRLASECAGFCGADIQSLCAQAVMKSFQRHFPQIADTSRKYPVNFRNIQVKEEDFWEAKEGMVPASQRTFVLPSRPLTPELEPLLRRSLDSCLNHLANSCPFRFLFHGREDFSKNKSLSCPRFLLIGKEGYSHVSHVAPGILHALDHLPVTVVDLPALNDVESRSMKEKLEEARRSMPSIFYLKDVSSWWGLVEETARQVLLTSVESLDAHGKSQILLFGTVNASSYEDLPGDLKKLFPKSKTLEVPEPTTEERTSFFEQLLLGKTTTPPAVVRRESLGVSAGFPSSEISKSTFGVFNDEISDCEMKSKRRRSLRLRGRDVEFHGLESVSRPKPGSYYRIYLEKGVEEWDRCSSDTDVPSVKKRKLEDSRELSLPEATLEDKRQCLKVDVERLRDLVTRSVEVTASCSLNSVIRLYEELETVTLRYSSEWDRTSLPEELEREISAFVREGSLLRKSSPDG